MTAHEDPWLAGKQLREFLRKTRDDRGLTQQHAAEALDWSMSKLARIEAGAVGLSTTDLLALLNLYKFPDEPDRLVALARAARRPPWYSPYREILSPGFEQFLSYEGAASVIMAFHPLTIPGPLQTEDYARAVIEASGASQVNRGLDLQLDLRLKLRLERRKRLEREGGPSLRYVLDEAALHRQVGGEFVMLEQLLQLKEAMGQPRVSVQVVPFTRGGHASMTGSFTILESSDSDADVLHREGEVTSATDRDDRGAVADYRERFILLSGMSLPPDQASGLVDAQIAKLRDTARAPELRLTTPDDDSPGWGARRRRRRSRCARSRHFLGTPAEHACCPRRDGSTASRRRRRRARPG
jgi:transcriptional regulator with XRE-family HTH domain